MWFDRLFFASIFVCVGILFYVKVFGPTRDHGFGTYVPVNENGVYICTDERGHRWYAWERQPIFGASSILCGSPPK